MNRKIQTSAWQPIETAQESEDASLVLLYGLPSTSDSIREIVSGRYEEGYTHGWVDNHGHHFFPTHWMPLPKEPEL